MGFFSSISSALSQINAADKPESQKEHCLQTLTKPSQSFSNLILNPLKTMTITMTS